MRKYFLLSGMALMAATNAMSADGVINARVDVKYATQTSCSDMDFGTLILPPLKDDGPVSGTITLGNGEDYMTVALTGDGVLKGSPEAGVCIYEESTETLTNNEIIVDFDAAYLESRGFELTINPEYIYSNGSVYLNSILKYTDPVEGETSFTINIYFLNE
ncbi:MAG: hypothetical protein IJ019_04010 [Alphaproteobacteria bacterium]|nr:hypothetical protein [Alphaproteobacteria bacterium]